METITQHSKGGYVTKSQRHTISRVSVCAYDMKNGSQRCGISKDTMESLLFFVGAWFLLQQCHGHGTGAGSLRRWTCFEKGILFAF